MERNTNYLPRIAVFVAGIAAGALTGVRRLRGRAGMDPAALQKADLNSRLTQQDSASAQRFARIEARLDEHAGKLAEAPSTAQVVAAVEQLLSKTMSSLDERLSTQTHSIEVLKTTVSHTDSLLERVLESLDSLQSYTDPAELSDDVLLHGAV